MKIRPEPRPEWLTEWEEISNDSYVRTKIKRKERIHELMDFINYYIPELKGEEKSLPANVPLEDIFIEYKEPGIIIDVGPGFCEFLEIARSYGNNILGIDKDFDNNFMGNPYLKACKLMAERQEIPIDYIGFDNWIKNGFPIKDNSINIINSIGSFDFVLREFCEGKNEIGFDNDSRKHFIIFDEKLDIFIYSLFNQLESKLKLNGCFMVYMNDLGNQKEFAKYIMEFVGKNYTKIKLTISDEVRIFKFQKVVN